MSDRPKTPWHLWAIGIVSLLWNSLGAMDYVMTQTRNETYMSEFTDAQLSFFYGFPTWAQATWATAVWAAVLGSFLLLLRTRFAIPVLWVSLGSLVATSVYSFVLAETSMTEDTGTFEAAFNAAIFIVAALLVWYAIRQRAAGVLR